MACAHETREKADILRVDNVIFIRVRRPGRREFTSACSACYWAERPTPEGCHQKPTTSDRS